jgi:hypothetical protein
MEQRSAPPPHPPCPMWQCFGSILAPTLISAVTSERSSPGARSNYISLCCYPPRATASLKSVSVVHKISARTSQETHYVSATNPNRLMLFSVRTIRNTQIYCACVRAWAKCRVFNAKAGGTYSYHYGSEGKNRLNITWYFRGNVEVLFRSLFFCSESV